MAQAMIDHASLPTQLQPDVDAMKLYAETWTAIRDTDQISFKLLSFVPFVAGSGAGLLSFLLSNNVLDSLTIILLSTLGALVTFGLYRWELRNIQTCRRLMDRATLLEQRFGLGELAGRDTAPRLFGRPIGKTEAEKIVYWAAIAAWIVPIGAVLT